MLGRTLPLLVLAVLIVATAGCGSRTPEYVEANEGNAMLIRGEFKSSGAGGGAAKANPLDDPNRQASWATLTGTITIVGTPPPPRQLNVNRDQNVCMPTGQPVYSNELVVDSDSKGIRDVLIYLFTDLPFDDSDAETPVWVHEQYSLAKHPELLEKAFDQHECVFLSHVFAARTQQMVKIINSDPVGHNTNIIGTPFNRSIPVKGFELWKPEGHMRQPTPVGCTVHPWMSAFIITRNNPYAGVTNEKGEFTIANIPADVPIELEFRVWLEKTNFLNPDDVNSITFDGEAIELKRGGKLMLNPVGGREYKLDLKINAAAFQ